MSTQQIVHFEFYRNTGRCDFYPRERRVTTEWSKVTCPRCIWRHDGDEMAGALWRIETARYRGPS